MATGTSVTFIHVLLYFFKILFSSQNLVVCIFLNCISCWYWERIFQIGDFPLAYVSSHTLEKTSSSKSWWNALLLKRLILTLREECCRPCLWRDPPLEIWSIAVTCSFSHWLSSAWECLVSLHSGNNCVFISMTKSLLFFFLLLQLLMTPFK